MMKLLECVTVILFLAVISMAQGSQSSSRESVSCTNIKIPVTPTLNPFPVTFTSPAEYCHDYPLIDVRIAEGGKYSESQSEWERGLAVKTGDLLYVLMWVENGAASNFPAEQTIAKNVKLTTKSDTTIGSEHFVLAKFKGYGTNEIYAKRIIYAPSTDRLEVVPLSGEIYDYRGATLLKSNLNIGNSTINIGDIAVDFQKGLFIRYKLRVVRAR